MKSNFSQVAVRIPMQWDNKTKVGEEKNWEHCVLSCGYWSSHSQKMEVLRSGGINYLGGQSPTDTAKIIFYL